MIPNYIDDGYEAKGYLAESEVFSHGEFRFWYRPMDAASRDSVAREISENSPGYSASRAWDCSYKMLLKQLTRWELLNRNGEPVKIGLPALQRMNQNLIPRVRNIIMGFLACDRDPLDGDAPEPVAGHERLEADAKNSVAG